MHDVLVAEQPQTAILATPQNHYEISRETAITWRRNWEADNAETNNPNFVRAFRMDVEELKEIMAIPGTTYYIRAYFGRAERGAQDKMILVAVNKHGNDMVRGEGARFFDFTSPCPATCDGGTPPGGPTPPGPGTWW